jgi:uncharacterized phage protein gp47/JayE
MKQSASLYNIVKGKCMDTATQSTLLRLTAKADVLRNLEADAKRQADMYALGVQRMAEQRAVYE